MIEIGSDSGSEKYFKPSQSEQQSEGDDEDGYLKVRKGDHLLYRFEVTGLLGKGSFAQVVAAIDHKNGQRKVAIKINRNTEIDH